MTSAQPVGLFLAVVLVSSACAEQAPPATSASGPSACESCTLVVVDSVTLAGESEVGVIPHIPNDVERAPDGRLGAVFGYASEPLWFASDGSALSRIGEFGEGPGEFDFPWILLPVPDSMVVFDQLGRVTSVPLEGGSPRTMRGTGLRIRDAAVVSWPERIAVTGESFGGADSVSAITFYDASDSDLRGLGSLETRAYEDPPDRQLSERILTTGSDSDFWAVDRYDYRVVRYSSSGGAVDSLHRTEPWAPNGTVGLGGGPQIAPTPRMVDLSVDQDGRIWTLIHVAHPEWARAWEDAGISELGTGERRASDLPGTYELYQARIEVFSPDLESVLVSEVAPGFVFDLLPGGYLARYSETEIGAPIVEVLQVRLGQRD